MENPIENVASKLSSEEKDLIIGLKASNDIEMRNNLYHNGALDKFFELWHRHFPQVKQSKSCRGCRDTVVKFYSRVADFVSNQRILSSEAKLNEFKEIVKKKKKKKVSSKK